VRSICHTEWACSILTSQSRSSFTMFPVLWSRLSSRSASCARIASRSPLSSFGVLNRVPRVHLRAGARNFASESKPASQEGGFQSSSPWRQPRAATGTKNVDLSLTWQQYSGSLVEFGLMFVCLGFAFAASLRASHHQTVHDEEIEALNYELLESEEEMERVKENWRRMEVVLKDKARTVSSSSELMIPLSLVIDLATKQVFIAKTEQEKALEVHTKTLDESVVESAQDSGPIPLMASLPPTTRIIMF